ncbi:MAG: 50S ribosomal protein L9 [Candidatus Colwellbacteria bacterium]|nr:50S ribosomal protein L9 [Candidatus Colwellbacteria bacterium]
MKVVLLQDLRGLGRKDDVRNVSDGYARNFLISRGIAKPATGKDIRKIDAAKHDLAEANVRVGEILTELNRETQTAPIKVFIKTGDKGEVFSSVKEAEVQEALIAAKPQFGTLKFKIELGEHIKELGIYEISINAGRGVRNTFKIEVGSKNQRVEGGE